MNKQNPVNGQFVMNQKRLQARVKKHERRSSQPVNWGFSRRGYRGALKARQSIGDLYKPWGMATHGL
ncbi:hypothetical protein [Limnohabitans sp.]|uniref:hypothetical protein n=1 Tax=Limnohabitans sp. TaxID=1907725 RepID=UPI0025BDF3F8|nr:hypothetical protein [Limnohabitans sp.]